MVYSLDALSSLKSFAGAPQTTHKPSSSDSVLVLPNMAEPISFNSRAISGDFSVAISLPFC